MAAETKPEKPVEEMVKNLKIDLSSSDANMPASKEVTLSDATSCISSGNATSSIKESDVDQEGLMAEQGIYYPVSSYYGYYYPGFDAPSPEWGDQGYYLGTDGLEFPQPAFQADNSSALYYMPGLQPGYNPYSPSSPGALVGVDGQYLGQHAYYASSVFPQPHLFSGYFPPAVSYGPEVVPAYTWDSSYVYGDGVYGNGFVGDSTIPTPKTSLSHQAHSVAPAKPTLPSKSVTPLETKGSSPAREVLPSAGVHSQSLKPVNKATAALPKGYFSVTKFPSYPNQGKGDLLYPSSPINFKENGRSWIDNEKLKTRIKSNGVGDFDLLNEHNRGPRTNNSRNTWISWADGAAALAAEGGDSNSSSTDIVRREEFNLPEFSTKHDNALFFVIKSYSEDDIHKSIKYNVWASTPNGNKRLDNAFQAAQEKMVEKGSKCPVFLFFSVNASGQFCGVAEMMGRVDFTKNMDFWQQDKWNGFFPVKWHIIKDVPNPQFRHIILENNDNKPVTNSRDTQEVKFPQGIEMLNIFKNFCSKTSVLDDFGFYENRQKAMQDKRIKLPTPHQEHLLLKRNEVAQVNKAGDLNPLISGLQAIELGAAKKNMDEPRVGVEVRE